MFWKRKKAEPPVAAVPEVRVSTSGFSNDEVNDLHAAKTCKARGRYELALKYQIVGTTWYAENVVGKPFPDETAEDRARFADYLAEYRAEIDNLPRVAADRDALLALLKATPDGLTQAELAARYTLTGSTKLGVMLNQLERGGRIVRHGTGKTSKATLSSAPRLSDQEFVAKELHT